MQTGIVGRGGGGVSEAYPAAITDSNDITALKSRSTFRLQYNVSAEIHAPSENVWMILTRAERMTDWNSTLTSLEGYIERGGTVRMQVPEAPGERSGQGRPASSPTRRWCGARAIR